MITLPQWTHEIKYRTHGIKYCILGWDGCFIYARRSDDVLVYSNHELDNWKEAPHGGKAEYGSTEWREDFEYMLKQVIANPDEWRWYVNIAPLDMTDEEFAEQSTAWYLPINED